MEKILTFLKALAKNNNREWFEKNKRKYVDARQEFEIFISNLLDELILFDKRLAGLDPRKLPFRIYRDVRFSKDKKPYKINLGAGISPGGKMMQEPGYYIHIQPNGKSFLAGGFYQPTSDKLARIRQEIDYNFAALSKVMANPKFRSWFKTLDDFDKLKTAPRGYPKDHPHLELLKHKSYIVAHYFTDAEVTNRRFLKKVSEGCRVMKPFNDFLNVAVQVQ